MSEFTKGPWRVCCGAVRYGSRPMAISSDKRSILNWNSFSKPSTAETFANAHLLASAPEMYEALKDSPCVCTFRAVAGKAERECRMCKRCAALAKAEGKVSL